MCLDPVTAVIGAATIGSTALGVGSSLQAGSAGKRAAQLQARIARDNAADALAKGTFDANRQLAATDRTLAGQTASVAARGFDPAAGSPLVIQGLSAAQGEIDRALIVAGANQEAANQYFNAAGAVARGASAQKAGVLGAATALLSGISSFAGLGRGGASSPAAGPAASSAFTFRPVTTGGLY